MPNTVFHTIARRQSKLAHARNIARAVTHLYDVHQASWHGHAGAHRNGTPIVKPHVSANDQVEAERIFTKYGKKALRIAASKVYQNKKLYYETNAGHPDRKPRKTVVIDTEFTSPTGEPGVAVIVDQTTSTATVVEA